MDNNKVTVRIYGQDYTITGEKTPEEIAGIGEYVDGKMHLIEKVTGSSASNRVAILSAVNIAEEYFDAQKEIEHLKMAKQQMENDSKYYLKMWEEAKKNFIQYKENVTIMKSQKQENDARIKELSDKCSEYENSFFDIQMENIRLKSELEKIKNNK